MTNFTSYSRQLRERRILSAAEQVLRKRGPEGTLDEIARVAGVAKGTVYLHFGSKDALVEAVAGRACRRLAALMFSAGAAGAPPVPLKFIFDRLVAALTTRAKGAPPRWLVVSCLLGDRRSHECPVLRGLTEALRQAVLEGDLSERFCPDLGALTLIGLAVAGATHWRGEETDQNARDELWRFFARGACVPTTGGPFALAEQPRAGSNP